MGLVVTQKFNKVLSFSRKGGYRMPIVGLFNKEGQKVGDIQLADNVFGSRSGIKKAMNQVVVALLANRRQGTQRALTRAEVRGGGAKIYRQKGTGRARHSSK